MPRTVYTRVLLYLLPLFASTYHGACSYALTDDCLKLDINELEDYISKLNFENVPTINMMTGGFECPVTALPFGALKSDWTRLLLLQQAQTDGSILKEKLDRVYKVLIYAYYRMEERFDTKRVETTFTDIEVTTTKEDFESDDKKYNASLTTTTVFPLTRRTIYSASNGVDKKEEKTTKLFASSIGTSNLPGQNLGKDDSTETSYNNLNNNTFIQTTRIASSPLYEHTTSSGEKILKINDVISQTSILVSEWTGSDTTGWEQETESNKELFSKKTGLFNSNNSVEGNEVDSNFTITTTESIFEVSSNDDKGSRLISTDSYNIASPPVQPDAEVTSTTAESSGSSQVTTFFSTSDLSGFPTSDHRQIVTMHDFESTTPFYRAERTTEPEIGVENLSEIVEETSETSDAFQRLISINDIETTMRVAEVEENSTISSISLKPTQVDSSKTFDVQSTTAENHVTFPKKVEKGSGASGTFERLTSNNDIETTMEIVEIEENSTITSVASKSTQMNSFKTSDVQSATEENHVTFPTKVEKGNGASDTFERLTSNNDIETTMEIVEIEENSTITSVASKSTQMNSFKTSDVQSATEENHVTFPKKVEKDNGASDTFERLTSNNDVETTMQNSDVQKDSTIPSISPEPTEMTSSTITDIETTTKESSVNPVKPVNNRAVSCIQNFHHDETSTRRTNNVYQTFKHDSIPRDSTDGSFYRNIMKERTIFNKPPTRNELWKYILINHGVSSTASPISKPVSNQTEETKPFAGDPSSFRKRESLNTSVEKTFHWFYSVHRGNNEEGGNDLVDGRGTNIECNGGK